MNSTIFQAYDTGEEFEVKKVLYSENGPAEIEQSPTFEPTTSEATSVTMIESRTKGAPYWTSQQYTTTGRANWLLAIPITKPTTTHCPRKDYFS